jgi:hypothetical protein
MGNGKWQMENSFVVTPESRLQFKNIFHRPFSISHFSPFQEEAGTGSPS